MFRRMVAAGAALLLSVAPAMAQTRWVMANAYPEANFHTVNIKAFLADIEKATDGKLTVTLHANASLMPLPGPGSWVGSAGGGAAAAARPSRRPQRCRLPAGAASGA